MKPLTETQQAVHAKLMNATALVRLLGDVLHVLGSPPPVPPAPGKWSNPPVPSKHYAYAVDAVMRLNLRGDRRTQRKYRRRYDTAIEELAQARQAKEQTQ